MNFTDHIAIYIKENKLLLDHLTIVLPSERLKKYISASLYRLEKQPVIAPEMITMDQWIKSHSKETVIDKTRALIRLFEIQLKEANNETKQSFDEFLSWGNILLSDFNEIDRYLLDAKQVFKNLADIKEIENWSFDSDELTKNQHRFMEFWDRLGPYYYSLNKDLSQAKLCYAGKAFKSLADNIQVLFDEDKKRHFLFAGFNALSPAEASIIKQLERLGRAHILIDADRFYYDNTSHEAGRFLRELSQNLDGRKLPVIQDELTTKAMKVEFIECAQKTGQVKVASTILQNLNASELDNTLLLLADENLISSVLKNLPKSIQKANITLGLPIRNTSIRTWVELVFSIQENKARFKTQHIYFVDFSNFLSHPFVQAVLTKEDKKELITIEKEITRKNTIFINVEKVNSLGRTSEILKKISSDWNENWQLGLRTVRELNAFVYSNLDSDHSFEKAVIECFDRAMMDFENIVTEGIPVMNIKSFKQLFHQHWNQKSIAYHGNPLNGIQIMGLLETRGLDFQRIICLGLNEGNLPPTNPIQTIIPMDLRRYLGLPTPREKQGLFAHHFYRLLHHCDELYATYNSATEALGSNEPSRYLMQLEMELSRQNPNIQITKRTYSLNSSPNTVAQEIKKSPEIISRLDELFKGSTSASMLKKYLSCPLDFYFRYVMDFGDEDSVEEEIENSTFGTFIHNTLEILYSPFARLDKKGTVRPSKPKNITSLDVEKMLDSYALIMYDQFMTHFNNDKEAFTKGKNLLSYQMALKLTKRFLESEVQFLSRQSQPVFIEALEREYELEIEIEVNGHPKLVNLKGYIDRIDLIGNQIRIIDYKSGKVTQDDVSFRISDLDPERIVESMGNKKYVLQLLMYAYMYYIKHGQIPDCGIISFISSRKGEVYMLEHKKRNMEDLIKSFPDFVSNILNKVFDTNTPFAHDKEQSYFSFCNYCD